jgi:hypothetical protein
LTRTPHARIRLDTRCVGVRAWGSPFAACFLSRRPGAGTA